MRLGGWGLLVLTLAAATPAVVAPAAAAGEVYVTDFNAFGGFGGVIGVDPATGARRSVSQNLAPLGEPGFENPGDVAVEPDGRLVVADFDAFGGGGGLVRVDPATGARGTLSANGAPSGGPDFASPSGVAVSAGGQLLVADREAFGGGGGVIRVDPASGARTRVSENVAPAGGPSFAEPAGIALLPGGDILVADEGAFGGTGGLIRVDPVSGARTTLSENAAPPGGPGFVQPVGIAVTATGGLLVTDEDAFGGTGGVIRVDPATGARTTVSQNAAPLDEPSFAQPYGITLSPDGSALVADFDAFGGGGGVIRVDPAAGARSRVSANGAPAGGPDFLDPLGIALAPPRQVATPPRTPPRVVAPRDAAPPVITAAAVAPRTFAVARRRGAAGGTTFRYRVSERARVTFTIERRSRGRRVRGRCRAESRANMRRRPCTRHLRAGSFSQRAAAGANRRRFRGTLRGRRLRPGRYRATLRARDAARNLSRPRRLGFRVVR